MPSILLTRSVDENQELEEQLSLYGFRSILCSLITYQNLSVDYTSVLQNYSDILITSKHAAKIIAFVCDNLLTDYQLAINLWVVGQTSAVILSRISFVRIRYVADNVEDLINHLPQTINNNFIYLSANEITKQLPTQITRKIIYNVTYTETLEPQHITEIMSGIDYILLYSQNCAETLIKLLIKYNLINSLKSTIVITISSKVALIMAPYFNNVMYANEPEQSQMINLLINHATRNNK